MRKLRTKFVNDKSGKYYLIEIFEINQDAVYFQEAASGETFSCSVYDIDLSTAKSYHEEDGVIYLSRNNH